MQGTLPLTISGTIYYYPAEYGLHECDNHDLYLPPYCNTLTDGEFDPLLNPLWCSSTWCYVDPDDCNVESTVTSYLSGGIEYSYAACSSSK